MVAELLAVIAGEDDQCAVPLPALLQVVEHAAELVVDLAHQAAIGGAHLRHLGFAHRRAQPLAVLEEARLVDVVDVVGEQRMLLGLGGRARRTHHLGHVLRPIHRMVRRRRDERRMRAVVAEMQEPRLAAAAAQVAHAALGEPGGIGQLPGDARRAGGRARSRLAGRLGALGQPDILAIVGQLVAVARHPAEIGVLVGLEGADGPEAVHDVAQHQEARVVRVGGARIGRRGGVADQRRIIAAAPQLVAEVGEAQIERNRVLHRAMVHQIEAGQQAGPRRSARRTLGEMVAEGDTFRAEPVDVGQLQVARAQLGQHQAAPLVDHDQQDVLHRLHAESP